MDLRARYVIALRRLSGGRILDLTPSQLSEAACQLIGAEGSGVVMTQPLVRVPVGATDADSRVAEELQASLGDGPCLVATSTGAVVTADERHLASRWPIYHRALVSRTRFRSTLSFPLRGSHGRCFAALDFYSAVSRWIPEADLDTIQVEVADLVAMLLLGMPTDADELPLGSDRDQVERRQRVWVAVGRLMEAASVSAEDAMALLRGHAFRHDLLLDDLAAALDRGEVTSAEVLGSVGVLDPDS